MKLVSKVAIVLLSYNSKPLVEQFLPKIIATTPNTGEYEVVVVDNASTDNTYEFVAQNFPQVRLIQLAINKGFTNGYCASLSQIEAEYYVLISSDIEVAENWLEPIIALMDSDKSIAACMPKVKYFHKRDEFEYAGAGGGFIDFLGYPFCRGRIIKDVEIDHGQYDDAHEVFWATGATMFLRADLYHKAGGLDNDFYAHMEEIDLCWRLKNMGYKIMVCPQATIYHMGGYIINYGSPAKVFRNHRNNLIMLTKNLPFGQLLYKLPIRFFLDWLVFLKMTVDGEAKAATGVLKAHYEFFRYLPHWLASRRKAQLLVSATPNTYGIYHKSIVVQYFLKGKKKFSDLNWP